MARQAGFKPEEHFRNLKGQQYLEVKWRVVWFREEHNDGYIKTDLVEHDAESGLAVFRAQAGFWLENGHEVYATGYGSETRRDFADYLEKSETKSVGRALALLGYGTAQAIELDEGERQVVDSPVDRGSARGRSGSRTPLAVVADPADVNVLRAEVEQRLASDAEAATKLPKGPSDMTAEELTKTLSWLTRRARAVSS